MEIILRGREAHAAQPETGLSPAAAMCELLAGLGSLPAGVVPADEVGLITVVGANLGGRAFGTSPGRADVWATLRSESDRGMDRIVEYSEVLSAQIAKAHGLDLRIQYDDVFPATVNSPAAVDMVRAAAGHGEVIDPGVPFRWSEDFGRFTALCDGALFGIGAGEKVADLHNPDYDFPDALIGPATDMLLRIVKACTG